MWNLSIPWYELILRCVIIYFFLLILLRISGKRQVGQLNPFDLVLLLVLNSNAVQNAMTGGDNSLLGGVISALSLVAINYFVRLRHLQKQASRRPSSKAAPGDPHPQRNSSTRT